MKKENAMTLIYLYASREFCDGSIYIDAIYIYIIMILYVLKYLLYLIKKKNGGSIAYFK